MERKEITALFIGNRDCYFIKEEYIEQAIIAAIHMGIRIFLNGGMGHFDETCAKVLHKLKERYPNIKSILVTAYHVPRTPYIDLFDEIIYPFEEQQETYFFHKRAIPERNKIINGGMVERCCQLCISGRRRGEYAKLRKGKRIKDHLLVIKLRTDPTIFLLRVRLTI